MLKDSNLVNWPHLEQFLCPIGLVSRIVNKGHIALDRQTNVHRVRIKESIQMLKDSNLVNWHQLVRLLRSLELAYKIVYRERFQSADNQNARLVIPTNLVRERLAAPFVPRVEWGST